MPWDRKPPTCSMSTSPSDPPSVGASYFDGRSAKAHPVTLSLNDTVLSMRGDGISRDDPVTSLRVSEPMGAAPRLISFPDGTHCEVRDLAGMAALLAATHYEDSWVVRLQHRWRWAVASVVVTVATILAGYYWGLPALSEWIAYQVPDKVLAQMGSGTLRILDRAVFSPTKLSEDRRQSLSAAFERLLAPGDTKPRYTLLFRHGGRVGANAMALPDGTIVVTDQLVALAAHDEEIIAVLAHELGHLNRRHGLRMLIQGSIVAFVVTWYMGDVSSAAAGLPTLLLQARYSRNHEREADDFGAAMLKANGISPRRLADMLAKLEAAHRAKSAKTDGEKTDTPAGKSGSVGDYLASHPATRERIDALNQAAQ
jgi:Zn-dependent protease with chaperone function